MKNQERGREYLSESPGKLKTEGLSIIKIS